MTDSLMSLYDFLSNIAGTNQLLFVLLVSLFGNIIPVIPIPYLIVVITISTTFPHVGIIQVAAVSALGAATGKFVSYGLGYGVRGPWPGVGLDSTRSADSWEEAFSWSLSSLPPLRFPMM